MGRRRQKIYSASSRGNSDKVTPQERVEEIQAESSDKLEEALDGVEENLDAQVAESLKGLVGEHNFDEEQQKVFIYLVSQMRRLASGLFVLAGIISLSVAKQLYLGDPHPLPGISLRGVAVSRLSHALNAVLVACLMWAGAVSFKKVIKSEDNQLAYAIQGIIQLSIIFMQIAPITISFAVVNIVEAAVRWPQTGTMMAVAVAVTTIIRASSLAVLLTRYVPGQEGAAKVILALRKGWKGLRQFPVFPDRAALVVSAGLLLPYSTPDFASSLSKAKKPGDLIEGGPDEDGEGEAGEQADGEKEEGADQEGSGKKLEYEFTRWEERVLEVVMDSMRMSALALSLQALSTVMLGVSVGVTDSLWSARSLFMNDLVDQSLRAVLLFSSAGCFRRVAETKGKDITHLLNGLGKEHGLGKLFHRMQKLAWGMAMFKALFDFILPALMSTHTWQKVQAWLVRQVVHHVPKGGKLVSMAGL